MIRFLLVLFFSISFLTDSLASAGRKKQPSKGQKKSAYTDNRQWEMRLKERLRSNQEIKMLSPGLGASFSENQIAFTWERSEETGKLFLGILSNENKEVYYKEVFGEKATVGAKEISMKPGLYYWVLESEQDVLAVGKFYFRK
jgi:hypothetical protein